MAEWLSINDPQAPERAAQVVAAGGLVILPTDTVYGVAADRTQPQAVAALYAAKQRPPDKAIPVLLADPDHIDLVAADVPPAAYQLANNFWPGPLTIIVPKHNRVPEIVSSLPAIGVRIPDHDGTRAVIRNCGGALAVTSANRSGGPDSLSAEQAASALEEKIALVLDGGTAAGGTPSTVVKVHGDGVTLLREGPISIDQIAEQLNEIWSDDLL